MKSKLIFWRISLVVTLFVFVILVVLTTILNVFAFWWWYQEQKSDIQRITFVYDVYEDIFEEVFDELGLKVDSEHSEQFQQSLGVVPKQILTTEYKHIWWDIYKNWNNRFLISYSPQTDQVLMYDITSFVHHQQKLLVLSGILVILFTFLTFVIANVALSKFLLKDALLLSRRLARIDVDNITETGLSAQIYQQPIKDIAQNIEKMLAKIKKVNESLKSFNSQVAHEFKTPLMIIASELEYMSLKKNSNGHLERIRFQVNKLNRLLDTFVLLTKLNSKDKIDIQTVSLDKTLSQLIKESLKIYKDKNVNLDLSIDATCQLHTNKEMFILLLKNLLDNAFKYSPQWGTIKIIWDCKKIEIRNDAIVEQDEDPQDWFELFKRGDQSKPGEGIWLYIVQKISKVLGYSISVNIENQKVKVKILIN